MIETPGSNSVISLSADERKVIMDALLIGLSAYGEIERLSNAFGLAAIGAPLPARYEALVPVHPTGSADTVGLFAEALRYIG